jgi:hypothetical protein
MYAPENAPSRNGALANVINCEDKFRVTRRHAVLLYKICFNKCKNFFRVGL